MKERGPGMRLVATIVFAFLLTGIVGLGHAWAAGVFDCRTLVVASSQEKYVLLDGFATAYNEAGRTVGGGCVTVSVEQVNSGEAEQALETGWDPSLGRRPDVWSPASTAWVALLEQRSSSGARLIAPGTISSLFRSPLIIAIPEPMARALGYPAKPIGWAEILALVENPLGWASVLGANPAWGRFKLGKTDPTVSTSGLHALLGTYFAAAGGSLTAQSVNDPRVKDYVAAIESSVVHYGETAKTFLSNLNLADDQGQGLNYVSAIAIEEEELINYNRGLYDPNGITPATPLVAIYPREGSAVADHPYLTLRWSRERAAAADFLDFLNEAPQQKGIQQAGFRNTGNELARSVLDADPNIRANTPFSVLPTNVGSVLDAILDQWKTVRKHARVLILVDVSAADTPAQGIGWATQPMIRAIGRFDPGAAGDAGDQVALWTFPAAGAAFATSPFSVPPGTVVTTLSGLQASRSPANLDDVLNSAIDAMTTTYEPSRIDAILLMTGSRDALQAGDQKLERVLRSQASDKFVRVFVVGPPSLPAAAKQRLRDIALAGRGDLYQPNSTQKLIDDVVSNF